MNIHFIGTKGYIKESNSKHKYHSSLYITHKNTKILIDCGIGWENKKFKLKPVNAILLTHWHPDHTYGLKNNELPYKPPVYATKDTWKHIEKFPITHRKIIKYNKKFMIDDITIEPFEVLHTLKYDAVGYKITVNNKSFFYVSDMISIMKKQKALKNILFYIGDGSVVNESLIRRDKKTGKIYGHSSIKAQASMCSKQGVNKMYVTHCGTEIVTNWKYVKKEIKKIENKYKIDIIIVYEGMRLSI